MLNVTRSHNGSLNYYLREGECTTYFHSGNAYGKNEILNEWKAIEKNEINGNKELGIRGRHDAQVRTNYMFSVPNHLSDAEVMKLTGKMIEQTPIKNCTYTICVHAGKSGETEHNKHVHLIVNERNLFTKKKDRALGKKEFLDKFRQLHRGQFNALFKNEIIEQPAERWRDRISMTEWKASPEEARKEMKKNTVDMQNNFSEIRNKNLPDVLSSLGAKQKREDYDAKQWHTPDGGRISVTGSKWYDHNASKGGGGAIDLVMHVKKCNFIDAVNFLQVLPPPVQQVVREAGPATAPGAEPTPVQMPPAEEKNWQHVRKYLVEKRKIDSALVDRLHAESRIYSDARFNAVFTNDKKTFCEIRGTGEASYHQQIGKGSLLIFNKANAKKTVAYVESSIDALSLISLGFSGYAVASIGQKINHIIASAKRILADGWKVIAAFDNDRVGESMSVQLAEAVKPHIIERHKPKDGAKDWNSYLQAIRDTQAKNMAETTRVPEKVSLKPKKKPPGHGHGHGFGMGM